MVHGTQSEVGSPPNDYEFVVPETRLRTRSIGENQIMREYVGDEMDKHLAKMNLMKKSVARDGSSIFRAVCEQVSSVQGDYLELRMLVETILRPIAQKYFNLYKYSPENKFDRSAEILTILSQITGSSIKLYRTPTEEPSIVCSDNVENDQEILLCETPQRAVYEPIYSVEMHEALAISQSIVYRAFYEKVIGVSKKTVDDAVEYIRRDIDEHTKSSIDELSMSADHHMHVSHTSCTYKAPSFPFCVCKSLDPSIYRNVEYDIYRKKAKEQKDASDKAARNSMAVKFSVGSQCLAREGGQIKTVQVVHVVHHDVRRVVFKDDPSIMRDYDVSDLRPITSQPLHHRISSSSNPSLFNRSSFFPGIPLPPFHGPSSPISLLHQLPPIIARTPPSSIPFGIPPPPEKQFGGNMGGPHSPTIPSLTGIRCSSSFDVPSSLPLRNDNRNNIFNKCPFRRQRAMSADTSDQLNGTHENKSPPRNDLTWWKQINREKEGGGGGHGKRGNWRRATEGDLCDDMNRPLRPKPQRLSTCTSITENEEQVVLTETDQSEHVLDGIVRDILAPSTNEDGRRGSGDMTKLPSLLPLPQNGFYASSDWTGDDTVFTADDGAASQMNMSAAMTRHATLGSSDSAPISIIAPYDGCIDVPYVSISEYEKVDKKAEYSQIEDGSDLPDKLTTRFFYNLGVKFFRQNLETPVMNSDDLRTEDDIRAPPAFAVPMPPPFISQSPCMIPPGSPLFFSYSSSTPLPSAPPPTPSLIPSRSLPPIYAQYCVPNIDGMPTYNMMMEDCGYGMGGGFPQHPPSSQWIPSPSPHTMNPNANIFFPQ